MRQCTFGLFRGILHDGPIGLVYFAVGKHRIQTCQCLGGTCKQHQSEHRTVQTMNNTKEDVARFGIRFLDVLLHCFAQGFVTSLVALYNFPCRLRNNDDVIIFVDYIYHLTIYHLQFIFYLAIYDFIHAAWQIVNRQIVNPFYIFMPPSIWMT